MTCPHGHPRYACPSCSLRWDETFLGLIIGVGAAAFVFFVALATLVAFVPLE